MDVNPVVREQIGAADLERDGQEIPVLELLGGQAGLRQRMQPRGQFAHRGAADRVFGADHGIAIGMAGGQPPTVLAITGKLLQGVAHQHFAGAAGDDFVARGVPHHAGAKPRIAETFEQGLGCHPIVGDFVEAQTALEAIDDRAPQRQALDPLSGPIGAHLVAGHPPDLLGVGLEKDRIELPAERIDGPVLEALDLLVGEHLRLGKTHHAQRRAHDPQIPQRFECAQRIGIEFSLVIDPAHPRALNEIVGQDLVPQINHLFGLRKEPVPTDVKAVAFVLHGPADPADVVLVLLDDSDRQPGLGQQITGGKPGGPRSDDRHVNGLFTVWR